MVKPVNPWARHYQSVWLERTASDYLPAWLRVAFLAFGSHRANGHARFKPGEIAMVLGTVDPATGEMQPMNKHNVQRAIKNAVSRGYLNTGSSSLCLIVPAHAIEGGMGSAFEECPLHSTRHAKRRRAIRAA